jgi:tetratricopeptide (TPR) repeat protein
MRGAIDWSWALLTPAEKLVFVQLSVFHGGFQFEAVDAVVELTALEDAPWPDEIVESLAEKSLVRARDSVTGARRFFLLESMRAYAVEKLGAVDAIPEVADLARLAAGCRQRHRDHYGTLGASNVASSLYIPGGAERRALLRLEQDNLDIAITTGLADGDGPGAARAWLARFWGVTEPRGPYRPAADRAAAILTLGGLSASLRARLDLGAGTAYRLCGVRDLAFAHCDAALPLARDANDHGLCTAIMRERGTILLSGGDLAAARASFDAAIEIARAYGLRRLEGIALGARAEVFFWEGDLRGALEGYDAAAAHLHAVGERRFFAGAVANRAIIEHELGELAPARAGYQVALTFLRRMANRRGESDILANVALIDQAEGRFEAAIRGQEAALLIDREGGNRPGQAIRFANLGITLLRMGRNAEAEIRLNESLALADGAPSPVVGSAYVHRGLVAARRRDFAAAEADLAAGEELLRMTSKTELAKATCVRGEIAVLAGDEAAARAALDAARAVADSIAVNPRSELSRSIVALESAISPPGAKTGETQ